MEQLNTKPWLQYKETECIETVFPQPHHFVLSAIPQIA